VNLCVFSDGDMSGRDFKDTDLPEPDFFSENLARNAISHLWQDLRAWAKGTNSNYFLTRRSSGDKLSSDLEDLENINKNNDDEVFILSKQELHQVEYINKILDHCDVIFNSALYTQ
jgi:hypothetical protein